MTLLLVGCYHVAPAVGLPCSESGQCPAEQICDFGATPPTCASMLADGGLDPDAPDATLGCVNGGGCTAATQPICDPVDHVCRGCVADSECSGACSEFDGQCVPSGQAIYLSSIGTDGGNCTETAPCKTLAPRHPHRPTGQLRISRCDGATRAEVSITASPVA